MTLCPAGYASYFINYVAFTVKIFQVLITVFVVGTIVRTVQLVPKHRPRVLRVIIVPMEVPLQLKCLVRLAHTVLLGAWPLHCVRVIVQLVSLCLVEVSFMVYPFVQSLLSTLFQQVIIVRRLQLLPSIVLPVLMVELRGYQLNCVLDNAPLVSLYFYNLRISVCLFMY